MPPRPSSSWGRGKLFFALVLFSLHRVGPVEGEGTLTNLTTSGSQGRYLVFPPRSSWAPTKVQLIMGLGLPMEVDVSMIVGYVMKFNYALPDNASYLTHPYASRYDRSIHRNPSLGHQKKSYDEEPRRGREKMVSATRWEIYRVIETALESFRVSGKGCLLRTVCHVAEVAFDNPRSGLFAELIHVLLTPSTTREKYEATGDQEYHSAEAAGRDNPGKCETLFSECDHNLLEYFTEINVIEGAMKYRGLYD
ncbi:uncharacterized protein [Venturia canescens]|uniref:uncharacterized protein n=1 Tax=Venturia canescens TaxID=32260 RepID=UPI001C9C0918|nr:uncharacterized protein LOC122418454 [Venturia canescens]